MLTAKMKSIKPERMLKTGKSNETKAVEAEYVPFAWFSHHLVLQHIRAFPINVMSCSGTLPTLRWGE